MSIDVNDTSIHVNTCQCMSIHVNDTSIHVNDTSIHVNDTSIHVNDTSVHVNLSGLTQYQWELISSAHPIPMGINSVSPPNTYGN